VSQHKKNLLEAFRSAGTTPESGPPAPRVEPRSPTPSPTPPVPSGPVSSGQGGLPQPPRWLFAVVGLTLAFAFGFLTGRLGQGEARAGDPEVTGSAPEDHPATLPRERRVASVPAESEPVKPAQQPAEPRLEESSLFDARNTHTIVVATYDRQAEDLALATYYHLRDARLPAFPPVISGKHLVVLVGAAPAYSDLEAEEQAVRALQRDGERPYQGAYRVRIDSILSRSK
jgi:hypothetical protein